jgi:hypothetical protein
MMATEESIGLGSQALPKEWRDPEVFNQCLHESSVACHRGDIGKEATQFVSLANLGRRFLSLAHHSFNPAELRILEQSALKTKT